MRIGFHTYQLGYRGTDLATLNYAKYNQEILGNESIIISTSSRPSEMQLLDRCKEVCEVILYPEVWSPHDNTHLKRALENIVIDKKLDIFYAQKGGEDDNILPANCKNIAHCVFRMDQPHGNVYAGISEYLAKKHGQKDFIPYIVEPLPESKTNLRNELGISPEAFVMGWMGGSTSFSVHFARNIIKEALDRRHDLYFFSMPDLGINHHRAYGFPISVHPYLKSTFIDSCDAMLHARRDGETFGLACAEFSLANKPVITYDCYDSCYDRAHLDMLGNKCIKYKNERELLDILVNLGIDDIDTLNWDAYSEKYNPKTVMEKFRSYL